MLRLPLLVALAMAFSLPLAAQTSLDGVMLGPTGPAPAGNAISLFNPDASALHRVGVTINTYQSLGGGGAGATRDTLGTLVRPGSGFGIQHHASYNAALSAQGRIAFVADWFGPDPSDVQVMAVDRDGRNISVLTDPIRLNSTLAGTRARPDISPNGQTVLYTVTQFTPDTLWTVPSDGSASPTAFPFAPLTACEQGAARAVFSPDGSEIAYLGWMQIGTGTSATCELAVRAMDADGSNDRVVFGPLNRGFNETWSPTEIALDWKADRILFSWPARSGGSPARRVSVVSVTSGEILHEVSELADVSYDSYQLSPDGLAVGYLKFQSPGNHWVEVRRLSDDTEILSLEAVYQHGSRPFFDWAEAAPVPTPARLEIQEDVLLWHGREVDLAPRLLDADGNVISYVVDTWSYERGPVPTNFPTINHFTNRIWAALPTNAGNGFGNRVCAQQAGLEMCRTHNTVNTPIFDIEVLDDDIAEKGRNPGRIRVTRYGPHDETATPRIATSPRPATHYLDYTLSTLPGVYRWAASSNLADTLQVREITLTPIDDAVAEAEFEEADFTLTCDPSPTEANSNCAAARPGQIPGVENGLGLPSSTSQLRWRFQIESNGAGSGLALASSTPSVIPASGQATLTINGQGMAAGATATLSGPSSLNAVRISVREGGVQMFARFELADAVPGSYDLTVTSGGQTATLASAVTVDASVPGGTTNVWAVLQSRSSRRGLALTQYVQFGNDGTADAQLTPLLIAVPEGFEPEFVDDLLQVTDVPEGFDFERSPWVDHTIQPENVPELCAQSRVTTGVNCDFLAGRSGPIAFKVALVFIPTLPAGGRGTIAIKMTREPGSSTLPWLVRVGAPFNTLDFGEGVQGALASAFEVGGGERPVHPINLQGCSTTAAGLESASSVEEQAVACLGCLTAGLNLIVGASGVGDCLASSIATARAVFQAAADGIVSGKSSIVASGLNVLANVAKTAVDCGSASVPALKIVDGALQLYDLMTAISKGADAFGAIDTCLKCLGLDYWDLLGLSITADPNDKLGPTGIGEGLHVAEFGRMGYTIRYENLPTATASVVELVITDTLDTSVYDLSTFQVGPITVPDTTFIPPSGLRAWTTFWDRRPAVNSIVRVNVDLDDETGIVQWTLSDLNPATFELWTTAEAGFIPPNDATGAGEGSVRFTIRAKDGLADGTVIANGATIRFDRNELISTPIWGNTLDLGLPSSRASSITPMAGDTTYVVRMTGSDARSGVHGYDVYAQAPGGPFIYAGSTRSDSLVFEGEAGVVYGLFALATDRVGNAENPKFAAEIFTDGTVDAAEESASSLPRELTLAPPYPNPSSGPVVFQVGLPTSGAVDLRVFDVRGREVARVLDGELAAGWHTAPWDASALPAGVYVVRAQTPSGVVSSRLTVVR